MLWVQALQKRAELSFAKDGVWGGGGLVNLKSLPNEEKMTSKVIRAST